MFYDGPYPTTHLLGACHVRKGLREVPHTLDRDTEIAEPLVPARVMVGVGVGVRAVCAYWRAVAQAWENMGHQTEVSARFCLGWSQC